MISFAEKYPDLVGEWAPENEASPSEVSYGSNRMIMWRGMCGHYWTASAKNRGRGHGCPYCSGNKVLIGYNDLKTRAPKVAQECQNAMKPSQRIMRACQIQRFGGPARSARSTGERVFLIGQLVTDE